MGMREAILRKIESESRAAVHPDGNRAEGNRVQIEFSAQKLLKNYQSIAALVPDQDLLPMLKANGYGHGAVWVARNLLRERSLMGFGVATLEEGRALREGLQNLAARISVVIFAGATPWSDEKGAYCEKYGLTPVIATYGDWEVFLRGGFEKRISYHLKFNTGMNRLGIEWGRLQQVRKRLQSLSPESQPELIHSHLALGEDPDEALSRQQRERFEKIRSELEPQLAQPRFALANSAAIWTEKKWRLSGLTEVARPGLGIYGVPPWQSAPERGVQPVMSVRVRIIAIQELQPGDRVGYGGAFRCEKKTRIGVLAVGYADGLHRTIGGESGVGGPIKKGATLSLAGQRVSVIGRVSMDQTTIEIPANLSSVKVGDWVQILGSSEEIWELSRAAQTIPYEWLTTWQTAGTERVERVYG